MTDKITILGDIIRSDDVVAVENVKEMTKHIIGEVQPVHVNAISVVELDGERYDALEDFMRQMNYRTSVINLPFGPVSVFYPAHGSTVGGYAELALSRVVSYHTGSMNGGALRLYRYANQNKDEYRKFSGYPTYYNPARRGSKVINVGFGVLYITGCQTRTMVPSDMYTMTTKTSLLGIDLGVEMRYANLSGFTHLDSAEHIIRDDNGDIILIVWNQNNFTCPLLIPSSLVGSDLVFVDQISTMCRIINEHGIEGLSQMSETVENNAHTDVAKVFRSSVEAVRTRIKDEHERQIKIVEDARRSYLAHMRELDRLARILSSSPEEYDAESAISTILGFGKVREIYSDGETRFAVVFNELTVEARTQSFTKVSLHRLPSVTVDIDAVTGHVNIYTTDDLSMGRTPHTSDDLVCFGSAMSLALTEAIRRNDMVSVVSLMIQFLEQANVEDAWGRKVFELEVIEVLNQSLYDLHKDR